jgi:hypothetical protein
MRLILPHLPNFIDRIIYNWIKDFFVIPSSDFQCIKISNENHIMPKKINNTESIDSNTIIGLIKLGYYNFTYFFNKLY